MTDRERNQPGDADAGQTMAFDIVEHAMVNLWAVANSLSRIKPPPSEQYRVTIFGSARIRQGDPLYLAVKRLASHLAGLGCDIVTGGGPGLMQAANEGAAIGDRENRIRSIGVRVDLPFEQGANPFVEQVYTHQTFFTRLHHFVQLSDAFVVFGGGVGTTLETVMVWQLLQVRHIQDIPLILVGEMWTDLVRWAREHMLGPGTAFAGAADMEIPRCVSEVEEACAIIEERVRRHRAALTSA
ncbi:MAG: LOG family protein [Bradymonadales bacterium]|nr:LOG family protein [Bradymonadales bacterium]